MKAKYANQRWLTVKNDNPATVDDYSELIKLHKNALRLYEYICYADYYGKPKRFAFSPAAISRELGIDVADIRRSWTELEKFGFINKYPNSKNEFWIQVNKPKTENNPTSNIYIDKRAGDAETENNPTSNIYIDTPVETASPVSLAKRSRHVKIHDANNLMMSDFTDAMKIVATELIKGNDYDPAVFAERFSCTDRSIRDGYNALVEKNYIFDLDEETHFCTVPYWHTDKPVWYNGDEDWEHFDRRWHIKWCDFPKCRDEMIEFEKNE